MSGPFKMKGYSYPGTSPLKQDTVKAVQDNTRTIKPRSDIKISDDAFNKLETHPLTYGEKEYMVDLNRPDAHHSETWKRINAYETKHNIKY
tara:strand:- start:22 stop:294 length:273 start_codon:yes stop_codon:yes gene_type:complete